MTNRNSLIKLFLVLMIILIGSFSFAEDKKATPPNSASPQQQDCSEDNKKTSNPDTSASIPKSTQKENITNAKPLTPPPFQGLEGSREGD